ncbi:cryptochrome/photolyase family protein [Marinivivus vitaminiproducens]|uniref:cryptochrome/photolyase family protein n=1 Tax=Marinivivus vitaminiproducens TaxID=3035935 RepID=UPI0027A1ECE8|nr:deoxyribodipyrimidine photo-lyase [Geminicoccaceae bacterium SCSIO 64248]
MTETQGCVVWLRNDLRLYDNPALDRALAQGGPVTLLYVLDDESAGHWRPGGAARWWLHHSLDALSADVAKRGGALVLRKGRAERVVPAVVREAKAASVAWTRRYTPWGIAVDKALKARFDTDGIEATSHQGAVLFEPWTVATKAGDPYKVFTPFHGACRKIGAPKPLPALGGRKRWRSAEVKSDTLDSWKLLPTGPDWAGGLRETWKPGEANAVRQLEAFLDDAVVTYDDDRNRPDRPGTSMLSPRLHWGELSPHRIWHAALARQADGRRKTADKGVESFLRELIWREFTHHVLFHFPHIPDEPLRPEFADFPWQYDKDTLKAWRFGRTGYPIVDAGMRQLRAIGWMHNRVRMITGSFLVKDLLLPWQDGEKWFWDELVDADLGNNTIGWQWVAGCGPDAAPYFRVFNPVTQGEKFDPEGCYVRRFVPELAKLPATWIHKPWEAPADALAKAGVTLGETYPRPIVDHKPARERALAAFGRIKKAA